MLAFFLPPVAFLYLGRVKTAIANGLFFFSLCYVIFWKYEGFIKQIGDVVGQFGIFFIYNLAVVIWVLVLVNSSWNYRLKRCNSVGAYIFGAISTFIIPFLALGVGGGFSYRLASVTDAAMEPTIFAGETIVVDAAAYQKAGPERGDVVVFRNADDPSLKRAARVVGLPGEIIRIRDGTPEFDGKAPKVSAQGLADSEGRTIRVVTLENGRSWKTLKARGMGARANTLLVSVPSNSYFLLGDNLDQATDSRDYGPVSADRLIGRGLRIGSTRFSARLGMAFQ